MKTITAVAALVLGLEVLTAQPIKTPQHVFGSSINPVLRKIEGDYPFPTEMTFIKFADHALHACTEYFDPDLVRRGDTIYVADWYLPWFTRYVHPQIKDPYILISNDSDSPHPDVGVWDYDEKYGWSPPIDTVRTLLYDPKIAGWFCKNLMISRHPKMTQIPIGPNIIYWRGFLGKAHLEKQLALPAPTRNHLLLLAISTHTNPVRSKLLEMFKDKPYCKYHRTKEGLRDFSEIRKLFYQALSESVFVICPPGYGLDTVRFWESVLLGTIPIVQHFELDDLYADLPVVFVHDWNQINEEFLLKKYEEIKTKNYSNQKAYFDYWLDKIHRCQKAVREGTNTFSYVEATSFDPSELKTLSDLFKTKLTNKRNRLVYKGALVAVRPFELASACPFIQRFYIQDPWGAWAHEKADVHLKSYTSLELLKLAKKMTPLNFYDDPYVHLTDDKKSTHLFFDLSYLRSRLSDDLNEAYTKAPSETLILGNCAKDTYVQEVLQRFMEKTGVKVEFIDTIWCIQKK